MTRPPGEHTRDRLSVGALGIASAASATAAVITSRLWAPGTALAAAVTPVIVAIVSELLHRPAEHVSRVRASRRAAFPGGVQAPGEEGPEERGGADTPTDRARESGRRPRLKIALVTAGLAFVIAVAALTLPELIFGKAVATHRGTTFFGGAPAPEQGAPPSQTTPGTTSTAPAEPAAPQTTSTTRQRTAPPSPRQPRPSEAPPGGQTTSTP